MLFGFLKKKPQYPATDRRREERYPAEDEFVLEFKAKQSHYLGSSRDISVHGVRFVTTCKPRTRQKVVLNFRFPPEFPGTRNFSVSALIVRVYKPLGTERYRVGCSLQHESETAKEAIRQFIHWIETKSERRH